MIELVAAEPCWIIQTGNPHLDEIHCRTRAAAEADVARDPHRFVDAIYLQLPRCCYRARCDDCGEPEGYAECDDGFHFRVDDPAAVLRQLHDLSTDEDGKLLCEDCRERAARCRRNAVEIDPRRELQVHATALRLPGL